jgi:YHS domain-containing protein
MKSRTAICLGLAALCCAAIALIASDVLSAAAQIKQATGTPPVMPAYDGKGELRLPEDWRRWVFVGSSLGLSYAQGGPATAGMEMFHETLMEPTAYDHFAKTGSFREGTQFVLVLHGTGEGVLPARRGRFAAEVHGVEMAVKDSSRRPEGWAYYNFGGMTGIRNTAQAMPKESCYSCHNEHAKRDNVFIQFYPLLGEVAPRPVTAHGVNSQTAQTSENAQKGDRQSSQADTALALKGLDPVLLSSGQEEMGKPEIIAVHKGRRYQFVSEPHRARFAAEPEKFAIQNDTCPVVAGAPVDPSLFAVHAGKIYAFATADCVKQFKARPAEYVKP